MSLRKGDEYNKNSGEEKLMLVMVKPGKASREEEREKGNEGWVRWKWIEKKKDGCL